MNTDTAATYADLLRRMPKIDLHCHLLGTVDGPLFGRLVRDAGLDLPAAPQEIYERINTTFDVDEARRIYASARNNPFNTAGGTIYDVGEGPWYSLHTVFDWIAQALTTPDRYELVAYEAVRRASESGTVHVEFSVDLDESRVGAMSKVEIIKAIVTGLAAGEHDFGVSNRLIVDVDRSQSAENAVTVVQGAIDAGEDRVAGIGMVSVETLGPPERFVEAFTLARTHGLHATAHSAEHVPSAANVVTCLDVLGCDRIDHGYFVLEDDEVVRRCREEEIPFTCIFDTTRVPWRPWRRRSITEMIHKGLKVVLCSDDPGMNGTTHAEEFLIAGLELDYSWETLCETVRNGVSASWLDDQDRARLAQRVDTELDRLTAQRRAPASDQHRSNILSH